MATTLQYTAAVRNLRLDQSFDPSNSGFIKIYSGTAPATADTALSGNTLLSTLTLGSTAFGAASSGVKTANAITSDSDAAATGTATFFRLTTSGGTVITQGSVGVTGSGSAIEFPTVTINQHDRVDLSSFVVTEAA